MDDLVIVQPDMNNGRKKLDTGKIALIDADKVKYMVTYNCFKDIEKSNGSAQQRLYEGESLAIKHTKAWVNYFLDRISDPIIFCFSGISKKTFRYDCAIEKEYKGQRKKDNNDYEGKMDDILQAMKFIQDNFVTILFEDLEADDVVAVLQDDNTYIVSDDKDLKQVPGYHYDHTTNNIFKIEPKDAVDSLAYQLLRGDTVDNIPGIPGMGDVKTDVFLQDKPTPRKILHVLNKYQQEFGIIEGTDRFVETWNLVKMRIDRGEFFKRRYIKMFDIKESIINQLKIKGRIKG